MTLGAGRVLLLLGLLLASHPARAGGMACDAPLDLLAANAALPATARAATGGSLRILVVGSASVLGPGTSGPSAAWPARLEALIRARVPQIRLEMVTRGARGLTTAETGAMIAAELAREPFNLVLWQAGTAEAVRGLDLDEMVEELNEGLGRIVAAGADAVLMDQQFSRFIRANANVDAYRDALRLTAAAHGVPVLRRWDLMQAWAEADIVDIERAGRHEKVAATDKLNDCLAQAMQALIRDGVAEARGRPGQR
ncbi:SGNH/GDSL hydrolase family protein [Belnapia sp. F-4-1]|uniref:SGNH/GDSL hydrolase family protein n=1 Tax=Belnapia sp. F-4-1 TaxID=1545443 RepID=UPI00068B65EF|nr:SGNH/GDSL hydrolase family protein [Belnapia sp. F-4-1]